MTILDADGPTPRFEIPVDRLMAPHLERGIDKWAVGQALTLLGTAIENNYRNLFLRKWSPQRVGEFFLASIPPSDNYLSTVIGVIDARGTEDEILTPDFQTALGLDDERNMRVILHSAAGINKLHLQAQLDHIDRDNAFLLGPVERRAPIGELKDEISYLAFFQENVFRPNMTKPSGEREQ